MGEKGKTISQWGVMLILEEKRLCSPNRREGENIREGKINILFFEFNTRLNHFFLFISSHYKIRNGSPHPSHGIPINYTLLGFGG